MRFLDSRPTPGVAPASPEVKSENPTRQCGADGAQHDEEAHPRLWFCVLPCA